MVVLAQLTAESPSNEPVDELGSLAVQLGCSIRVCLDAEQITEDQALRIVRFVGQYAGLVVSQRMSERQEVTQDQDAFVDFFP